METLSASGDSEVSQDSTAEDYGGECFGFSKPVRVGCLGFRQFWGHMVPLLASGESLYFCTLVSWSQEYLFSWITQETTFLAGVLARS